MKNLRCKVGFLLLLMPFRLSAQSAHDDSLIKAIERVAEDTTKVAMLYDASREFYHKQKILYALQLSQEAYMLSQKLDVEKKIAGVRNDYHDLAAEDLTVTPSVRLNIQTQLQELKHDIDQLDKRLDTLSDMKNEFNRRTISLSEDLITTKKEDIKDLSTQQQYAAKLAKSNQEKFNWVISGSLILLSMLSFAFFQFYSRRKTQFRLELNQLNNKVLRTQLNPHFIFNALNSIKKYIQQCPDLAVTYLSKFSTLMRQVLENSQEEKISLQDEIAMLENYMTLESLRVRNGFDYEVCFDHSVDAANTMIPPLLLQPILENAIWHGLDSLNRKGKIKLSFVEKNDLLEATIEDNGVGAASRNPENPGKKRSLGMQITLERIELLNRRSKFRGSLTQQLAEQGSIVKIAIPV